MILIAALLSSLTFKNVEVDFPSSKKNLRQWGSPVVADLDQDGWPDLVLNDHGYSVRIMWNNKGIYAKPYDLIVGDMHGVAVGDIDKDGKLEIVVSRGGGSGTNARNTKIFSIAKNRKISDFETTAPPLELMRGRTVKLLDIDNDGDLDLFNFAFPDSLKKGESENFLYENQNGNLIKKGKAPFASMDGQKTLLTDLNSDGYLDFLWYGHGEVRAFENQQDFTFIEKTKGYWSKSIKDVTAIAELDFDNDGDMDLIMSRGKPFGKKQTFFNEDKKLFAYYTKRGAFNFSGLFGEEVVELINVQSQWPHKSLYLGESGYEYQYPGETHSGRDVRLVNSDALGFVDQISQKGTYLGFVGNGQWRVAGNIWAPSSMVIRGITKAEISDAQPGLTNLLLENRKGKFVDVTSAMGLEQKGHSTSVAVADFDNNGFVDLVFRHRGSLIEPNVASLFLNTGKRFELSNTDSIVTHELGAIGLSVEAFDYDLDGQVDVLIGNERGRWSLFKNQHKSGRHIGVKVASSPTGGNAHGAVVKVTACGKSQYQRYGATAAGHAQSSNPLLHFGLGECDESARATVRWSDGQTDEKAINQNNQFTSFGK